MAMYEVAMVNQPGSFFTDRDPTRPEGSEIVAGFIQVQFAHFEDAPGEQQQREERARLAFSKGETRERSVHIRYVAWVTKIHDPAQD